MEEENEVRTKAIRKLIFLVAFTAIMLVSSTYAWFTLSTAPEVSGITTVLSAEHVLQARSLPLVYASLAVPIWIFAESALIIVLHFALSCHGAERLSRGGATTIKKDNAHPAECGVAGRALLLLRGQGVISWQPVCRQIPSSSSRR